MYISSYNLTLLLDFLPCVNILEYVEFCKAVLLDLIVCPVKVGRFIAICE